MATFVQDDSTQLTTTTITSNISTESVYLLSSTAASTYATITNVNTKENILSFTSPLIRTSNNISIDLSLYDTIALRNSALGSYLLSSTASSTYATISNLNTKQNIITVSTPLTKDVSNNITIDLSLYDTIALRNTALGSYLPKTGGTLTGSLTTGNITISGTTGRLNIVDDYHYIEFSQSSDITTIQEYGTIKFNIGQTKNNKSIC